MLYITCKFDLIRYSEAKREEPNRQTVKRLRRKGLPLVATSLITFKFVSICSVMRNLTIYRFFGSIAANSMHFNLFKLITENRPQIRRVLKKHRETKKNERKDYTKIDWTTRIMQVATEIRDCQLLMGQNVGILMCTCQWGIANWS